MKKFSEFLEEVSIEWLKKFFNEKIDEVKRTFKEIYAAEYNELGVSTILNDNVINKNVKKISQQINESNNSEELIKNLNEFVKVKSKDDILSFLNSDERLNGDNIDNEFEINDFIADKFSFIIFSTQFSLYVKAGESVFNSIDELKMKIGADEKINDVNLNDVFYILNNTYNSIVNEVVEWGIKNKKYSSFIDEELKILVNSKWTLEEKNEAVNIIYMYFTENLRVSALQDVTTENMENKNDEIEAIAKSFNFGIMSSNKIKLIINLMQLIKEKL